MRTQVDAIRASAQQLAVGGTQHSTAARGDYGLDAADQFLEHAALGITKTLLAFGLESEMEKKVGTLSGGTKQKVSAAIAFLFNPTVLVLDEPTAGLDPVASGILKDKIQRARAGGRTVLVTSHIIAELEEISDDVAFLCDGSLRFAGPIDQLLLQTRKSKLESAVASLMRAQRIA